MAFNTGPLVSPEIFAEFMTPYYKRACDYLTANGVASVAVDTDGNCIKLIDEFLKAGVTGLYPFEVKSGMDIYEVRKMYPPADLGRPGQT